MAKAKVKTAAYVVTRANTLGAAVGDVMELTDAQAGFLVNKVRLQDEVEAEAKTRAGSADVKKLEAELKAANATIEQLTAALQAATPPAE